MRFTVDATTWMKVSAYRLQEDYLWKELNGNRGISEGDLTFSNPFDARKECDIRKDKVIEIDGVMYQINPDGPDFTESGIAFVSPHIHRTTKPRRFSQEEMRHALSTGDDSLRNTLALDIYGYFRLADELDRFKVRCDPRVAVYSPLPQGEGYVGPNFSAKANMVFGHLFRAMANRWVHHLKTGHMKLYTDFEDGIDMGSVWRRLKEAEDGLIK